MTDRWDAIVIGSGAGGISAAARLAHAGLRVLVLEEQDRLGGRFSTLEIDGYKVPTGAVAIEIGGIFEETFRLVDAPFEVRAPSPPVFIQVGGRNFKPGSAVWKQMTKIGVKRAAAVASGLRGGEGADDEITVEDWVQRYTKSKVIATYFQSLAASIFTVNSDELPMSAFIRLLRDTGGYKDFGFAPHGNVVLVEGLADAVRSRGGEVRTGARVAAITSADDRVTGVEVVGADGARELVEAPVVISNAGPRSTAAMVQPGSHADAFAARAAQVVPSSMLALAFSSSEPLIDAPGIWTFTDTERMCNLANLTAACPEVAPAGRYLYEAYSVPRPSIGGEFDEVEERRLLEADLARVVEGYASQASVVHFKVMRGDVPAQQASPGLDVSVETPLPGLYEVGDGVKPYGWIGTTACAETARVVADLVLATRTADAAV